jgi:hypothetical protein
MKKAYKSGDTEKGEYNHLMQYTMKILLNSLYGATALPSILDMVMSLSILSEAITSIRSQNYSRISFMC